MKIAIIATSGIYPIHIGGPGNVGYFLAREFGISGNNVTVFVRAKNKLQLNQITYMPEFNDLNNVKFRPILIEYNLKTLLNMPLLFTKTIEISYLFAKEKFDIVLYNSPPVDICVLIPFISAFKNVRQFIIFHGYGGLTNNNLGKFLIKIMKDKFENCIAVSAHIRKIPGSLGFSDKRIKVIYNGVDIIEESNTSQHPSIIGNPKILYVGALTKLKCLDILIEAFSCFIDNYPDSLLYIIGDGEEKSNLIQLADNLGIASSTSFKGFIQGNELICYYKSCDLFVLPSCHEGMPIALLEAMYHGLPAIISDSDLGPKEIIDNGAICFTFKCDEPDSLYEQMISFFNKTLDEREFIFQSNQKYINKNHNWNIISKKYMLLFTK